MSILAILAAVEGSRLKGSLQQHRRESWADYYDYDNSPGVGRDGHISSSGSSDGDPLPPKDSSEQKDKSSDMMAKDDKDDTDYWTSEDTGFEIAYKEPKDKDEDDYYSIDEYESEDEEGKQKSKEDDDYDYDYDYSYPNDYDRQFEKSIDELKADNY